MRSLGIKLFFDIIGNFIRYRGSWLEVWFVIIELNCY